MMDRESLVLTNTVDKRCARCGEILPIGRFHYKKASKDGFQSYCVYCESEYRKTRRTESLIKKHKLDTVHLGDILKNVSGWNQKDRTDLANYMDIISRKLRRNTK